jgi:hypothetical protein
LIRKSEFVQRAIEPITASITCEHPSCSITAMSGRGKSDQEELSFWIAEARIWFPPILPVFKPSGLLDCYFLAPLHKPWAKAATDNVFLKLLELSHLVLKVAGARLRHPIEEVNQVLVECWRVLQIAHVSGLTDDMELRPGDLPLQGF